MKRSFTRLAWFTAAALSTTILVACGEDLLAPPDGTACTVGTIAPGDSLTGNVSGSSCAVFSDYNYVETVAESWTLHAKAHTAYVVRVYHLEDTAAFDNWDGDVWLYGRNAAGDAAWAGGWWGSFGAVNANNGQHRELIFTSAKDQVVSIRVEASEIADTGHYAIQVESCPAMALADGEETDSVSVELSCTTKTMWGSGVDAHVAFWTFQADTLSAPELTFTRTSGEAFFKGWITGEGLDFGCWGSECTWEEYGPGAGPWIRSPSIYLSGEQSAAVVVHADSVATAKVELVNNPVTAPRPPFTGPARAGRNR